MCRPKRSNQKSDCVRTRKRKRTQEGREKYKEKGKKVKQEIVRTHVNKCF